MALSDSKSLNLCHMRGELNFGFYLDFMKNVVHNFMERFAEKTDILYTHQGGHILHLWFKLLKQIMTLMEECAVCMHEGKHLKRIIITSTNTYKQLHKYKHKQKEAGNGFQYHLTHKHKAKWLPGYQKPVVK